MHFADYHIIVFAYTNIWMFPYNKIRLLSYDTQSSLSGKTRILPILFLKCLTLLSYLARMRYFAKQGLFIILN